MNIYTRTACLYKASVLTAAAFVILWLVTVQASVVDLDQRLPNQVPYNDSLFIKAGPNCLDPHWTSRERAAHLIVP